MNEQKPIFLIQSACATRSGYGAHSRDLIRSIIRLYDHIYDIKLISTKWGACPPTALVQGKDDDLINRLHFGPLKEKPYIYMQITVPNEFSPQGNISIGITAGVECNAVDPEWINGVNRMDHVIVPSKFTRDVFINTKFTKVDKNTNQPIGELKVDKNIDILFEGIDCNLYKKVDEIPKGIFDELHKIPEQFCFVCVGHWLKGALSEDRKNIGMVIKTFLEVFKNKPNKPGLILKTSGAGFSKIDEFEILDKISSIACSIEDRNDLPNIYLLHGDLTDEEMNGLYNHNKVKAFVSFTKGEGFFRPAAEFARTGKPMLVSNWSGHLDFLTPKYHNLLPGQLTPVHDSAVWQGVINKGTMWFTVNYSIAGSMMLDVFNNYKDHLEKSRGSSHHMKMNFSMELMDAKLKELIDGYIANKPQMQKLSLPKLMKVNAPATNNEPPKITLPKLKKITA